MSLLFPFSFNSEKKKGPFRFLSEVRDKQPYDYIVVDTSAWSTEGVEIMKDDFEYFVEILLLCVKFHFNSKDNFLLLKRVVCLYFELY